MSRDLNIVSQNKTEYDIEEKFPFKVINGAAVFDATDWDGDPQEFYGFDEYWVDICNLSEVRASVLVLPEDVDLPKQVREHIGDSWNKNAKKVDIERAAIVAPKIKSKIIELRVDQDILRTKAFESYENALNWAADSNLF